jgi:hypothetical protein
MSSLATSRRGALALAVLAAASSSLAQAEPRVTVLPLGFEVEEFRAPQSYFARTLPTSPLLSERLPLDRPLVAAWGKEGGVALHLDKGELKQIRWRSAASGDAALHEAPRNALPSSRMQISGPLTVYLAEARTDYRHGAFGKPAEAGQVVIAEKQALGGVSAEARSVPVTTARVSSGPEAVFEDREPRLVALDQTGTPEILVVKSYLDKGSALAIIGKSEGEWKIRAETPPAGEPRRWLNPAAVADFSGGGRPEIALVRTPHLDGVLQIWTWEDGKLALKHETAGYANHAFGSTALDNAVAVDTDGDGRPELVIPTLDRKSLAILRIADGIKELRRIPLPARVERGVAALGSGPDTHILAALEDGRVVLVRP